MAQAGALGGVLRPISKIEFAGVAVGQAAVLVMAMGIGDVLKATAHRLSGGRVPQWLVGVGVAWVVANWKPVRAFLGSEGADLAALAVLADSIDDQFDLRNQTSKFLGQLTGQTIVSGSPPVATPLRNNVTRPIASPRVGDIYAGIFR